MKLNLKMPDLPKVKTKSPASPSNLPANNDLSGKLRDKLKSIMKSKSK